MNRAARFSVARQRPAPLSGPSAGGRRFFHRGFTLLEMCIVLLIIALLAAVAMPAIQGAFSEHAVREDSHQLALMVRTAMIQSAEQHRPYVIALTKNSMALRPLDDTSAATAQDAESALFADSGSVDPAAAAGKDPAVTATAALDGGNKLLAPDPVKTDKWVDMPDDTQWIFEPGELCPATKVRFTRGAAYLEMTFSALTGGIDQENTYFP